MFFIVKSRRAWGDATIQGTPADFGINFSDICFAERQVVAFTSDERVVDAVTLCNYEASSKFIRLNQIHLGAGVTLDTVLVQMFSFLHVYEKEVAAFHFAKPLAPDVAPAGATIISPQEFIMICANHAITGMPLRPIEITLPSGTVWQGSGYVRISWSCYDIPEIELHFQRPMIYDASHPNFKFSSLKVDSVAYETCVCNTETIKCCAAGKNRLLKNLWKHDDRHYEGGTLYPYGALWKISAPLNVGTESFGSSTIYTYTRDDEKWFEIDPAVHAFSAFLRQFLTPYEMDWNRLNDWIRNEKYTTIPCSVAG